MNNPIKTLAFLIVYPVFWLRYSSIRKQYPVVKNSIDSLLEIIETGISLSRFGDGELNLISGCSIGFQKSDPKLQTELKRVLLTPNSRCRIGLPNVFNSLSHFKLDAKCFWLFTLVKNWNKWKKYLPNDYYLDTQCSRFYMDIADKNYSNAIAQLWKKLWNNRDLVIIEGAGTKMGVGTDLFENASSISRIICPSKNAFDIYDKIYREALQLKKNSLILIALGPTASVLAYDLSSEGFQAIDTGHLDLEYNWMKLNSHKKEAVAGRAINELKIDAPIGSNDKQYISQIIRDFSLQS